MSLSSSPRPSAPAGTSRPDAAVGGGSVNAGQLAMALVAAAKVTGVEPDQVFELRKGRTRILAGAALVARYGVSKRGLCRVLKLGPNDLCPANLAHRKITTDEMLAVVEAMGEPPGGSSAGPRLSAPRAAAASEGPARKAEVAPAARAKGPAKGGANPVRRTFGRQPRDPLAAPRKAAPVAPARPCWARPEPVVRLKPVTARIAGWASHFLESPLWELDEVAALFGVHPDGLLAALEQDAPA